MAIRHIMVATDGSDGANRAVDVAAELTNALGGDLLILTIGGNLPGDEMRQLAHAEGNISDALESLSTRILMDARERARHLGVAEVHIQSGWGDAAEAIIEIARRQSVDAIVIGRRGRGRLAGLLLGSVSQKVVSLAPCAAIVVP
jgi:nucleotide-binding universal stress UspA family protein